MLLSILSHPVHGERGSDGHGKTVDCKHASTVPMACTGADSGFVGSLEPPFLKLAMYHQTQGLQIRTHSSAQINSSVTSACPNLTQLCVPWVIRMWFREMRVDGSAPPPPGTSHHALWSTLSTADVLSTIPALTGIRKALKKLIGLGSSYIYTLL